jgi:signal transduction histidine kinase
MAYVSLRERASDAYRRAGDWPEWPLLAATLLGLAALVESSARLEISTFVLLLGLAATLPVALVPTYPVAAATTVVAAILLFEVADLRPPVAGLVVLALSLYRVGQRSTRAAVVLVVPLLPHAVALFGPGALVLAAATLAAAAGVARRRHDEAALQVASTRMVETTMFDHARQGERTRIARELHDVVAHHISMIAVQAETARLTTPGLPDEGGRRLVAIGDTARAALTEMRRLLGVLREETVGFPGGVDDRRPQPGLADLTALLDEARDLSSATTRLIVRGPVAPLDPGVELAAYRIAQEALTNARRHAPGSAVDVTLEYGEEALRLSVRDNGPGSSTVEDLTAGHGLAGMRERAAAVGGSLRSGTTVVGGFLIEAVLPTTGGRP